MAEFAKVLVIKIYSPDSKPYDYKSIQTAVAEVRNQYYL